MDKISRLKKKENKLVAKGNKAVDMGKNKKADRVLGRAAKTENRVIKAEEKKASPKAQGGLFPKNKKKNG